MLRITVSHSESAWIFVAVFESCVVCAEVCARVWQPYAGAHCRILNTVSHALNV